jgi:demethylmenaquinone methyltransferase/2-methoxy-6-polyprenyl-1,4-benzoquinol methylase
MTEHEGRLPVGEEKTVMVRAMFDRIASRYDLMNTLMTFGLDRGWRTRTLRSLALAPGGRVLDLASGTGGLAQKARQLGFASIALDLSFNMLAASPEPVAPRVQADALALPFADGAFEGVVSGYALRNFSDLARTVAEIARVLSPGGRLGILEVDRPGDGLIGTGHRLWLDHGVPRLGAWLSDASAYAYLPRSLGYLPRHDELTEILSSAGFRDVKRQGLLGQVSQIITATRAGARPLLFGPSSR